MDDRLRTFDWINYSGNRERAKNMPMNPASASATVVLGISMSAVEAAPEFLEVILL